MKLQKGMIISPDNWWYVVINIRWNKGKLGFDCLCDNANNIYYWEMDTIEHYMTLDEIGQHGYGPPNRDFPDDLKERGIPFEVITNVLSGAEDDRCDHWHEGAQS